jgi:hypothetical protein
MSFNILFEFVIVIDVCEFPRFRFSPPVAAILRVTLNISSHSTKRSAFIVTLRHSVDRLSVSTGKTRWTVVGR